MVMFKSIISFKVLVLHYLFFLVLSSLNCALAITIFTETGCTGVHNALNAISDFAKERGTNIAWYSWGTEECIRNGNCIR